MMTYNTAVTIQNMTSLYLYGTMTPPDDFAARLRSSSVKDIYVSIDVDSYMSSVGRYANLFQTDIVKAFFNGDLNLSQFADQNGIVSVSFHDIILGQVSKPSGGTWSKLDGNVAINQYITDSESPDWAMRAFVFGSTGFTLSENDTVFNINMRGVRSVAGGAMLPYRDNFDLDSNSKIAQAGNYLVFKDLMDPYDIGRKVWIDFSQDQKDAYGQAHSHDVYKTTDQPTLLDNFVSGLGTVFSIPVAVATALANSSAVKGEIAAGADYIHDNRNVVFANNDGSSMSDGYGKGTLYNPDLKNIFVGGESSDTIGVSGGDSVYSGAGDDFILLTHDEHELSSDQAYIFSGDGADQVLYGTNSDHNEHHDIWVDAAGEDKLLSNYNVLNGGSAAIKSFSPGFEVIGDGSVSGTFHFINADDHAAYEFEPPQGTDLRVQFSGGGDLTIRNYTQGVAGLTVPASSDIYTTDLESYFPTMRGALFEEGPGGGYFSKLATLTIEHVPINM